MLTLHLLLLCTLFNEKTVHQSFRKETIFHFSKTIQRITHEQYTLSVVRRFNLILSRSHLRKRHFRNLYDTTISLNWLYIFDLFMILLMYYQSNSPSEVRSINALSTWAGNTSTPWKWAGTPISFFLISWVIFY